MFVYEGILGGASPVFLRDRRDRVLDAAASDRVIRSPRDSLTRVGPVSWTLASPSPGD